MDVGIRELKARLSHYVRVAREGERILITDRGRPVAVLSPPPIEEVDDLPDALRRLLADGRVSAPTRPLSFSPLPPAVATRSVAQILADDRAEA